MSVQFGRWNFDGQPISEEYLQQVRKMMAPYGPDGSDCYRKDNVAILYQAFCTTKESHREIQPHLLPSGEVLTWDGRLDNRDQLISQLRSQLSNDATDLAIVAAIYEQLGTNSFAKLMGDWALAIWNPRDRSIVLAKDFLGARHLYYAIEAHYVAWSTILDPLVLLAGHSFELDEEYIAGWLSFFPAAQRTPYADIHAVPPSSFVHIVNGRSQMTKYWDFDPSQSIRYRTDREYEEHFRTIFAQSVCRRLRSDKPILAELSGGMDSSSIVCMADVILGQGKGETSRLDTVSYYDDSEPNWNERPYFSKIEQMRGRQGCHIDVGSSSSLLVRFDSVKPAITPDSQEAPTDSSRQFTACVHAQANRVLLSGIGGDEVLGGVPVAIPELADLLATRNWGSFGKQLLAWALSTRSLVRSLTAETIKAFVPSLIAVSRIENRPPLWLNSELRKSYRAALGGYRERFRFCGPLPSQQFVVNTLDVLRRQIACFRLRLDALLERRYPYLDRDLLEFVYAIPREQLIRPGMRRSLMRRTLQGIVPNEIINRKRKAFVARRPHKTLSAEWSDIKTLTENMESASLKFVNARAFSQALQNARSGSETHLVFLMRTLALECWLRHVQHWQLFKRSCHHHSSICESATGNLWTPEVATGRRIARR